MRLSKQLFAQWVGSSEERIDDLIEHDLIEASEDGSFESGAVHVARFMLALIDSGIPLHTLANASEQEAISMAVYPQWFPVRPSSPGRPFHEFRSDLEADSEEVTWIYRALGLAEPDASTRIDEEEQGIIWELVSLADSLGDPPLLRRAFATYAVAASEAVEKGLALYAERYAEVAEDPIRDVVEGLDPLLEPWSRLSRMSPKLMAWLYRRHLESGIDSSSVLNTERYLADLGYVAARPAEPEAIVFVDIAGYTSISEREGDMLSALLGTGVGDFASEIARPRGGRLVKLLGDGAMLHFTTVEPSIAAAVEMLEAASGSDIPPLHIGISSGPMVYRDGDYYGHTVNTAARLAGEAPAGVVYVTADVARASKDRRFDVVGPMSLKGMSEPIEVHAWTAPIDLR